MKLNYYQETDSLYIDLTNAKSYDSKEISEGIVVDYDKSGSITGIDIQHASKKINLERLETNSLPLGKISLSAK